MDAGDTQHLRTLLEDYLQRYASRDERLISYFSDDFSGFTGGGNVLVKDKTEWVAITRQDFAQIREPLRLELKDLSLQALSDTVAVATTFFTIHLPVADHFLSRETARLVLIFRKEAEGWKIVHSSISVPYHQAREGEVYPLSALAERHQTLEALSAERTIRLSEANDNLRQSNEELARLAAEHRLAAAQLRESEALYRLLTEDVSDVVWKADRDLRITYISPVDERLRGFRPDEVVGHHVFEMFTDEGIATVKRLMAQGKVAERNGAPMTTLNFEAEHRCKDGRLLWAEVQSKPERDAYGTITGYHGITREITERKSMQDQVHRLAFFDPLTELANRRLLDDRLRQALGASERSGRHGALVFLDLDNFKSLNDTQGHEVGDRLLVEAARRLTACVRESDTVARFGGGEFVVLLNRLAEDDSAARANAAVVAKKIGLALAEPYVLAARRGEHGDDTVVHHCTASIGVATFHGRTATEDELLKWADAAMYEAKDAGRNCIRFHSPPSE